MKSVPDRNGNVVVFPADADLFWLLAVVSAFAFVSGCLLSGAPVGLIVASPRAYIGAVLKGATARGEPFFWFIWAFFCVAIITLVAATLVGYATVSSS